ncbi:putative structural polyprotein [Linepithema humile picorna-like virus 3]|nr:putative structural polyprotein [Linepithema humile picorna-like virus 3]
MTPGYEMPMRNTQDQLTTVESNHSIIEFLRRPHLMNDLSLKDSNIKPLNQLVRSTNFLQSPIFVYNLPWNLARLGGKDRKLQNFEYFKADVVVKVTINANNMTSGRFWLCYAPIDTLIDKSYQIISKHRGGVTAYPGVEMDIQINNSVELTVPYLHWAEAMSTTSNNGVQDSMAMLYMFALTPLRSAGDYSINIQTWGWFDNITLVGPTPNPLRTSAASADLNLSNAISKMKISDASTYKDMMTKLNVSMQVAKTPAPKGKHETTGPITQIASKIGAAANIVKDIPIVSEVATTVAWISDIVGGVASIFGWSKPANAEPVCKLQNVPGYGFAHAEGQDQGLILGLSQKNQLGLPNDSFASAVDEMDIEYLCRNPAVAASAEWSSTTGLRKELVGLKVNPYADIKGTVANGDGTTTEYYSTTPCDFVGSLFGLWRGTMCYRVVVTKTAYHTGRLEINFIPNQDGSLSAATESTNTYRYIMDITNEAEVIIKVPFFSESYMLPIANDYGFTGRLTIRPVTSLLAPSAVASTVDVLVWKWMEDVTFAVPSADDVFIYNPRQPAGAKAIEAEMQISFVDAVNIVRRKRRSLFARYVHTLAKWTTRVGEILTVFERSFSTKKRNMMMRVTANMQIIVANTVSDTKTIKFFEGDGKDKLHVLQDVSGEAITNLRYLTRAFRYHSDITSTPSANATCNFTAIQPYDNTGNDYISYISHIFRYARGGLNYKFFESLNYIQGDANQQTQAVSSKLVYTRGVVRRTPEHITWPKLNPMHEVSIPFYSKYKRIPTAPVADPNSVKVQVGQPYLPHIDLKAFVANNARAGTQVHMAVYRAAKDDFSFGVMVGPPQLWRTIPTPAT